MAPCLTPRSSLGSLGSLSCCWANSVTPFKANFHSRARLEKRHDLAQCAHEQGAALFLPSEERAWLCVQPLSLHPEGRLCTFSYNATFLMLANFLHLLTFPVVYSVAFPRGAAFKLCPEGTPIGKIRKQCFLELAPLVGSSCSVVFEVPTGSQGPIECPLLVSRLSATAERPSHSLFLECHHKHLAQVVFPHFEELSPFHF